MNDKFLPVLTFVILLILLVACSSAEDPTAEPTPLPVESPTDLPPEIDSSDSSVRSSTPEDYEGLLAALLEQGVPVEMGGPMLETYGFSIPANFMTLPNPQQESLLVWVYDDEISAETDAGLVSPGGGSIGTTMFTWIDTPHFYHRANLIVVYVGSDPATLSALESVLGRQFAGG